MEQAMDLQSEPSDIVSGECEMQPPPADSLPQNGPADRVDDIAAMDSEHAEQHTGEPANFVDSFSSPPLPPVVQRKAGLADDGEDELVKIFAMARCFQIDMLKLIWPLPGIITVDNKRHTINNKYHIFFGLIKNIHFTHGNIK